MSNHPLLSYERSIDFGYRRAYYCCLNSR